MADDSTDFTEQATLIVVNYVSHNKVEANQLPELIAQVHAELAKVVNPEPAEPEAPKPDKAAVRKSVTPDYLTSFIDGRKYKSLKRHLSTRGLSPDEYRAQFGLPKDYPMVAASYSAHRSEMAKRIGLGQGGAKTSAAAPAPEPTPEPARKAKGKAIKPSDETFT